MTEDTRKEQKKGNEEQPWKIRKKDHVQFHEPHLEGKKELIEKMKNIKPKQKKEK